MLKATSDRFAETGVLLHAARHAPHTAFAADARAAQTAFASRATADPTKSNAPLAASAGRLKPADSKPWFAPLRSLRSLRCANHPAPMIP